MTQKMSWLDEQAIVSRALPKGKAFPLGVSLKSATYSFIISPLLGVTSGIITGIRVQDVALSKWFNWSTGAWDVAPIVTPGAGKLYIAFWAVNQGLAGNLTLTIKDDTGAILVTKTASAPYGGAGVGIEWTGDMPSRSYAITLTVTP